MEPFVSALMVWGFSQDGNSNPGRSSAFGHNLLKNAQPNRVTLDLIQPLATAN